MVDYAWAIVKDCLDSGKNSVGTVGPRESTYWDDVLPAFSYEKVYSDQHARPFQMLDDDDIVIYEGLMVFGKDSTGFEPLDDFGMGNAGCVTIRYMSDSGEWECL